MLDFMLVCILFVHYSKQYYSYSLCGGKVTFCLTCCRVTPPRPLFPAAQVSGREDNVCGEKQGKK